MNKQIMLLEMRRNKYIDNIVRYIIIFGVVVMDLKVKSYIV